MKVGNGKGSSVRLVLIGVILTCAVIWYVEATGGAKRYGPLTCVACRLAHPQADDATKAFLKSWEGMVARTPAFWTQMIVEPGDIVVVCNSKACVSYAKTDSGQYMGGDPVPQSPGPGVIIQRGGGGGGAGDGGDARRRPAGGGIGIGTCIGKCNGSVTVGGARQIRSR